MRSGSSRSEDERLGRDSRARADRAAAHLRGHAPVRGDRRGRLASTHRGLVTTEWSKAKRKGVLIDANQNGEGKTIASVYSVRPKEGAPVSTPLRWEEVDESLDPAGFTMEVVRRRVAEHGDLFEGVLRASSRSARPFVSCSSAR